MKPIADAWLNLVDVTYLCPDGCIYCSRHMRHLRPDQRFSMTADDVRKAIVLYPLEKGVGIIGGEPTISPHFEDICRMIQEFGSRARFHLFTAGGPRFEKLRPLIDATFGTIYINRHTDQQKAVCKHQPSLVANGEAVFDSVYRAKLVWNCWVQLKWCPTVTSKGAFFCEIAAAWDHLIDGPGGYRLEPGWWQRTPAEFADQVARYCHLCGMPVPLPRQPLCNGRELITPKNLELLRSLGCARLGPDDVEVFDQVLSCEQLEQNRRGWNPGNYREDIGAPGQDAIFNR